MKLKHLAPAHHGALALCVALAGTACTSVKKRVVNNAGDALSGSGTTFSSDDDPEFIATSS
jgi:hypothetical protein